VGRGHTLPIARREITVQAQAWQSVSLEAPPVILRGHLTVGQRMMDGLRVGTVGLGAVRSRESTTTDDAGRFSIGLPAPGTFRLTVGGLATTPRLFEVALDAGENRWSEDIAGGIVELLFHPEK